VHTGLGPLSLLRAGQRVSAAPTPPPPSSPSPAHYVTQPAPASASLSLLLADRACVVSPEPLPDSPFLPLPRGEPAPTFSPHSIFYSPREHSPRHCYRPRSSPLATCSAASIPPPSSQMSVRSCPHAPTTNHAS
jgi:hypothetical protein